MPCGWFKGCLGRKYSSYVDIHFFLVVKGKVDMTLTGRVSDGRQ